jgi:hypothetical protein
MKSKSESTHQLELRDYVIQLYRGATAYADVMPEAVLDRLHIETKLDKCVLRSVQKGRDVLLTGNPGDGKTHLLRVLKTKIVKVAPKAVILLDASETPNTDIIAAWKSARRRKVPLCVAVNEGVLKELADSFPEFEPVCQAQHAVEESIAYVTTSDGNCAEASGSSVTVFDLSRRNVLSAEVVTQVLDKVSEAAQIPPPEQPISEFSDFWRNVGLLRSSLFRARLQQLFDRIARRGYHATLRELQALVSYLLFRGSDLSAMANEDGLSEHFLTELIFSGKGRLFDALRDGFDPGHVCHPKQDLAILTAQVESDEWDHAWAREEHSLTATQTKEMEMRRRRFYFFCKSGEELLRIAYGMDADFDAFLQLNEREVIRTLLGDVNAVFGISEDRDSLRVWKCHRFDHEVERALCSTTQLSRNAFEIARPRLRPPMCEAFNLTEDHVLLRLKSDPAAHLRVDFSMFVLLQQAQQGLPILSLDNELTRRVWQFMERLAGQRADGSDGEADVVIRDMHTSACMRVTVDLEHNKYLAIEET